MESFSNEQKNNLNNNDQSLVSIVNLISNNLKNQNPSNNNDLLNISSNENNNAKKSKKDDDILSEIDQIIGKDDINSMLPFSSSTGSSETNSLNDKKSSTKVEIKDNHFINKGENSPYNSYLSPFELTEETLNQPISTTIFRDLYLI